ncbi:MAG: hypothetical protein R3B94_15805 [Hyphomonas sp.]
MSKTGVHKVVGVNFFTGRTSYVRPKQGSLELATGSGAFVRLAGIPAFLTARHNLTGRHWTTGETLHSTGRCPHSISINVPIVEDIDHGARFGFKETIVELERDYRPIWNELTVESGICDLGTIFLDREWEAGFIDRWKHEHDQSGNFKVGCINDYEPWQTTVEREHKVGSSAFVLGFPLSLTAGGPNRPIWRGGSIATEPRADFEGWPTFLVDVAGRKGLSGAPVLVVGQDGSTTFAGIYSGRVLSEEDNSDLGYVWKCSAIHDLFRTVVA